MNEWCAILLALSIVQIRFYRFSVRVFTRVLILFWLTLYIGLLVSEIVRRICMEIGLGWWSLVVVSLTGYLLGELGSLVFRELGKQIKKRSQITPSFFSFSILFLMLAWFGQSHVESFGEAHAIIIVLSLASVILSLVLKGIEERLLLSDIPKALQGFPILLIAAALLLLGLYGFAGVAGTP